MSVEACAAIVEMRDPPRFRAIMAAPPATRDRLFPLYAFNAEVARAPWVTSEPGIAEMRLQWWIDALSEIAAGGLVRRHEVVVPLALALSPDHARQLQGLVEARFNDIETAPFADARALETYLQATSGTLMQVAASLLGQRDDTVAAAGKRPFAEPDVAAAIVALAESGLRALPRAGKGRIIKSARPAFLPMAGVRGVLRRAKHHPQSVLDGTVAPGELASRIALTRVLITGRW